MKINIGIDRCKFELDFENKQNNIINEISIISPNHIEFGEIILERGRMMMNLCLPKYFDIHNAVPVGMKYLPNFDEIIETVYESIKKNYEGRFKTTLNSIEINITEVFKECDYEKLILLLNHAMLDSITQNARYENKSDQSSIKPITSGIKTRLVKGKYRVKAYDKQKQIEAEYGISLMYKPLRIEIVYSKLALEKMFGKNRKLDSILSKAGLTILTNAYINTMKEILNNFVYPYLDNIHVKMMEHMNLYGNIQETYCEFKEVIYDQEQIRRVLKEWYKKNGRNDYSRIALANLNKKYNLPKGPIRTLENIVKIISK